MRLAVLILKRSFSLPKAAWRLQSTRRTLEALDLEPLLAQALRTWDEGSPSPAIIEWEVAPDGTAQGRPSLREADSSDEAGVFELEFVSEGVKLRLSQEACHREVYMPRRPSRHIATLGPWETVRVVLNGKADWPSGRFYYVQDYHVVVCDNRSPERLRTERLLDLQEDLI